MSGEGFDDRDVITSPICDDCRHASYTERRKCAAFPNRIPLDIWCGNLSHNEPVKGDNGIVFEPMTEDDYKARREALEAARPALEAEYERRFPGKLKDFKVRLEAMRLDAERRTASVR